MESMQQQVENYMRRRLSDFASDPNAARVRAQLATLRRGVGRKPGDMPDLWGLLFADMPEEMMSRTAEPTAAEWAAYTALTLYATHQQGAEINRQNMHIGKDDKNAGGLGRAVARLVKNADDRERIARRFNAFATASDMTEAAHHLRGLIQLLRAEEIPLDYVKLAGDLYRFQNPKYAPEVRLSWGQDFYWRKPDETDEEQEGQVDSHA